jgi:hypothetical protein
MAKEFSVQPGALRGLKVGDPVVRMLGGTIPHDLVVTSIVGDLIVCGAWTFDMQTGAEIDDELGWGPKTGTGSIIRLPEAKQ